jgi:hypothetical protein
MTILDKLQRGRAAVVYPHERLCRPTCLVFLDGQVLYADNEHLSTRGAELLRPLLARELARPHAAR